MADGKENDLMTRREVAEMSHTTPQVVAYWALRKKPPLLTEIRTAGNKPRYRRPEVQALWDSGYRW
jgi:hypothetical protein